MQQRDKDSIGNTIVVALVLCLVCSLVVSVAAVGLKGFQETNKALDVQKNILDATGLASDQLGKEARDLNKAEIKQLFQQIETKVVDISTGEYLDWSKEEIDGYDSKEAASDKERSVPIGDTEYEIGPIKREPAAKVYLVKSGDKVEQVVLPIYGNGLWSTLYGFLALDKDLRTIKGITFYEHKETPGLGGEVDNPEWKKQWKGLSIYSEDGEPAAGVNKGPAPMNSRHLVDGLSGATITSRGVTNLVRYWVSEAAFKPYLEQLRSEIAEGGKS